MLYRFYTGGGAGDLAWVPAAPECRDDPQALLVAMSLASERRGAELGSCAGCHPGVGEMGRTEPPPLNWWSFVALSHLPVTPVTLGIS